MDFINVKNKAAILRREWPFVSMPKMKDIVQCIHCWQEYQFREVRISVLRNGDYYIHCKNAPKCDGNPLDIHKKSLHMNGVQPIIVQEAENVKLRLVWANKEKTRLRVILWAYKHQKNYTLIREFETYMESLNRDRLEVYYRDEDAAAFWQKFIGVYAGYEDANPDMSWEDYLNGTDDGYKITHA